MFPISGPGWLAPTPSLQAKRARVQSEAIEAESASQMSPTSFIHPGTALEFRRPLEALLAGLPPWLQPAFVGQGYCLHVIDSQQLHPLTLEVPEVDLTDLPSYSARGLHHGGASSSEEVREWCQLIEWLNPDLDLSASAEDCSLLLPDFHYWGGRRLPRETVEFLLNPSSLLGLEAGKVAGLVCHLELPGIPGEARRVLFWDTPFRQADPQLNWYVLHEVGHLVDYCFSAVSVKAWRAWRQELSEDMQLGAPTSYAETAVEEFFAESFAAWATQQAPGGGTSDLARQRLSWDQAGLQAHFPHLSRHIETALAALRR